MKGAALYAFNDAVFSEDDWKGIRMLLQSVKQHDPHKVGYFGMGFKSVFHITGINQSLVALRTKLQRVVNDEALTALAESGQ